MQMEEEQHRFRPVALEISLDAVTITYMDNAQPDVRGIRKLTHLEIDPSLCEAEVIDVIDAMEQLIMSAEEQVRQPPASIASRLR